MTDGRDPFNDLVSSFTEHIALLKHLCIMRSTAATDILLTGAAFLNTSTLDSLEVWQTTLRELDLRVTQIERYKADLRTGANRELRFVGQSRELIELLKQQQQHVLRIETELPAELRQPKQRTLLHTNDENMPPPAIADGTNIQTQKTAVAQPHDGRMTKKSTTAAPEGAIGSSTADSSNRRRRKGYHIPALVHVSKEELNSCPSYIRGRITVHKVNAAIDEIMQVVQEKYRILSMSPSKMGPTTRNKYQVYYEQQREAKELVFFTECDIKASQHVKFDATGKAILGTLQSLGRLKIDGGRHKKYVLLG